jgi:hypothetical protein
MNEMREDVERMEDMKSAYRDLVEKREERDYFQDLGVDESTILK